MSDFYGRMLRVIASFRTCFAVFLFTIFSSAAFAADVQTIKFSASSQIFVSPERGFWRFVDDDFAKVSDENLAALYDEGLTLGYGIVLLDKYRKQDLPPEFLAQLGTRFAATRKAGIKIILRFAYNYPSSSSEYENAKDAPLDIVLKHIGQLTPVIRKNADVIAVMQAGFIGAWGEGHTSSNKLDSDENKAKIRDALLVAVPPQVPLQWRYPADLIAWQKAGTLGRFGFHNDCFLSSPTDVGTYAEDENLRSKERKLMAALTDKRFHSVETCDADKTQLRSDCAYILNEGAQFHVAGINLQYYRAFHERWKKDGCMPEITAKMGYRLRLVEARFEGETIALTIANDGWARLARPRDLELRYDGKVVVFQGQTLDQIGAGEQVTFNAKFSKTDNSKSASVCFAAPDPSSSLRDDPRYAIRFANSDKPEQTWMGGAFCFKTY
jgi:Domain of unknown function (DUF4874)/Domain of unknown function (DUF4832)